MPAEPTIDYETLAQDAMRGVVRAVLSQAAKSGLPGDHHFYISFDTAASGVVLSKRLKEKYPSEMTIVLQHRFWDLAVNEDEFEVKLTFDGIPERLVVPYTAIRVFFDPSVRYGIQFEDPDAAPEGSESVSDRLSSGRTPERATGGRPNLRSTAPKKPRVPRKAKTDLPTNAQQSSPNVVPVQAASGPAPVPPTQLRPATAPAATTASAEEKTTAEAEDKSPAEKPRQDNGGAQIVRLDAFRKK
ncbi:Stringent starvation protein B [Hyphomicrobium sp. 1Nfss2.1]|uniref:SspB family protein n=1 Tax=Hyphomicrobium sp. 1Nfss2.1 TaxID=3413936 RepID=UPI003C7DAEC8